MADHYRTPDGWSVEVVQLADGERLRIRHHGFYLADVRSVAGLERWIPRDELDRLERDTLIQARRSGCHAWSGARSPGTAAPHSGDGWGIKAGPQPGVPPRVRGVRRARAWRT